MNPNEKLEGLKKVSSDTKKFIEDSYSLWGAQQDTAKQQGWYPSTKDPRTNVVTFRTDYDGAFNTVRIPGEKEYGHIEILGKPDKTFDVVIRKANGDIDRTIYQNANADTVQQWMTKSDSNVAGRVQRLPDSQKLLVKE